MTEEPDLFDVVAPCVERDGYGRPYILPPSGGWSDPAPVDGQLADGRRPYTRVSTLIEYLHPAHGLGIWQQRHIALSVARHPDLQEVLCGLTYADRAELRDVIEQALARAAGTAQDPDGALVKANRGTALHAFVRPDGPTPPTHLTEQSIAAQALLDEMKRVGLEVLESETFVVLDYFRAAGSFDHLVRCPDGAVRVLDVKTGQHRWVQHVAQLEFYSDGKRYDVRTGERSPLHADLDLGLGYVAHVDLRTGEPKVVPVDLTGGLSGLAYDVHRAGLAGSVEALVGDSL